jgi:hypothetical protein
LSLAALCLYDCDWAKHLDLPWLPEDDYIAYVQKMLVNGDLLMDKKAKMLLLETSYYTDRLQSMQKDIEIYYEIMRDIQKISKETDSSYAKLQRYIKRRNDDMTDLGATYCDMQKVNIGRKILERYKEADSALSKAGLLDPALMQQDNVKMVIAKLQECGVSQKLQELACTAEEKEGMKEILRVIMQEEDGTASESKELQEEHLNLLTMLVQRTLYDQLLDKNGSVDPSHPRLSLPSSTKNNLQIMDMVKQKLNTVKTLLESFRAKRDDPR